MREGVKVRLWAAVLLLVLPTLAYLPTLAGELIGDDAQISHNAHLRQPDGWKTCLTEGYHFPFDAERNEYRPLTSLSFWAQVRFTGGWPGPLHLVNLLLHLAVVLALRGVLSELLGPPAALAAAAIFGVHPLMSEAVSLLVGRADLLATLFALIAWRLHLAAERGSGFRRAGLVAGTVGFLLLAVFSKESGIAVLGAMLITDLMAVDRKNVGREDRIEPGWARLLPAARSHGVLWLLVIPLAVGIRVALRGPVWYQETYLFIDNPLVAASWPASWATAWWVIVKGWALFLWPSPLSSDYSYNQIPVIQSWSDPRLGGVAFVVVALGWWLVRAWGRGWRVPAWGFAAWFCLNLPTSNLVVEIGTIMGERLLYLPGVMLAAVAGSAAARLMTAPRRIAPGLVKMMLGVVVTAWFFGTLSRSFDWVSAESLAERQATSAPASVRTWKHLATQRLAEGDAAAAVADLDRALAITDSWSDVWMLRSEALVLSGRPEEAVESALRAHALGEASAGFYAHLAGLWRAMGRSEDERETLRQGLARHPGDLRLRDRWTALTGD